MKISMKSKKFSHTLLLPKNEIIKDIEKDSNIKILTLMHQMELNLYGLYTTNKKNNLHFQDQDLG
jgi:hypothetical protein